ncbi:MAG: hypothetical protein LBG89_04135 [Rickettsiales bacterium]|jgi:opacity protein-like surface antigen|nr:hypothetical protein [Rickettsiales bacterium]
MKKIFLAAAAITVAGTARADFYMTGWFSALTDTRRDFKPDITGQWMNLKTEIDFLDNIAFKGSVGYAFENGLRAEADFLRLGLRNRQSDSNGLNAALGVESVRGLYDFKNCTIWTPYIGAGIYGFDIRDGDLAAYDFSGVLGVSAKLYRGLSLDFQYERNWYRDPDYKIAVPGIGAINGVVVNGINLWKLGIRYEF